MNQLRDFFDRMGIRSFRDVRENKAIMTGAAVALCLVALLVLVRGFIGGDSSRVSTEAELANQALIEQMQVNAPPPAPEVEEPQREPGYGRKMETLR